MKYKIGDKVRVREDLAADNWYGNEKVVPEMTCFKGKIVIISKVQYDKYKIEEDNKIWWWTDEMFSGKVSEDFSPEESGSQNTFPEKENSSIIIIDKTTKVKLLLL